MTILPKTSKNLAQSPTVKLVVGQTHGRDVAKASGTAVSDGLLTRNPAPEASPPSTPSKSGKFVLSC